MQRDNGIPEFLFICGAVGSGNTFMFNCLTQDENVYGVNEDALGSTLHRLIESERDMGTCPHSIEAFLGFLQALRRDRRTLILKTPSNLRYIEILKKYLPRPRFVTMIREPHAAITSGIARHANGTPIEKNAHIWLGDCRRYAELGGDCLVVTFEDLARNPEAVMRRISDQVLPLSESVFTYARRMHDPQRADPQRWKTKVDKDVQRQIEHWVDTLQLEDLYRSISATAATRRPDVSNGRAPAPSRPFRSLMARGTRQFFRGWYRIRR